MIVKLLYCWFYILFLSMNMKSSLVVMLTFVLLFCLACNKDSSKTVDFESAKELILMRKIADRVARYTGDSTTPILPIKQLSMTEFQIPFESSFSFMPDSIVAIINQVLKPNLVSEDYLVEVAATNTGEIVYGYAFIGSQNQDIVPCSGRNQIKQQYTIKVKFKEKTMLTSSVLYLSSFGLIGLVILTLGIQRLKKRKNETLPIVDNLDDVDYENISIGNFQFYPDELFLKHGDEKIILTIKEAKLLSIFAKSPNSTIDRTRLQKEVWEDEGVIVGRSLDVFISKLRKKLEQDSNVKLINVHGKGYKLEIGEG